MFFDECDCKVFVQPITIRVVSNGLNTGAIFASGWAILLIGLAMLGARTSPTLLVWPLILAGGLSATAFLIPIFAVVAPLLYVIWSIWLGITLLKAPVSFAR